MKLSVGRQIQIAFLFALIILVALGIFSYRSSKYMASALNWEKHTQEVLLKLDDVLSRAIDVETGGRGYIITGNEKFLEPYDEASQNIKRNLQELENLISDNPAQKAELKNLAEKVENKTTYTKNLIESRRTNGIESARETIESGRGMKIMDEIRSSIKTMKDEEKRLLQIREKELNDSIFNTLILLFLGISLGVVSLVFANFVIGRETKKRFVAENDLRQTNKSLETRVEERTKQLQQKNDELEEQIIKREQFEKYHQVALEAGSLGTWIFDPETDSVDLNERGLGLFGLSELEFDGLRTSVFSRIHEEDSTMIEELFQKSLTDKSKFNAEFRVILPDETVRWNHCTGQLQLDENGNIKQVIGNCRDITDSKEGEFTLKRSEQNVRNIIDNLFAFVGVLSPDGTLIEANRTALESASLKLEDVVGKKFADTYWWSYSKEIQEQLEESIQKVASGERVRYDINVRLADDVFIPIDFMMAPLYDDDGNITHLIPSGLDLTPRKEAEDALRRSENFANAILNSLTAHVAVVNKEGNIIAVNDAWNKFAEDNSDENQIFSTGIGQNYLTVCQSSDEAGEEVSEVARNLKAILDGEKDSFNHEYPCHSPTEKRWFMLQISSMKGEDGGAAISHINITDRKKAELELKNSEEFNRSIFENSPDCVKVLELDGKINSMNKNGLCLMEIDDFAEVSGKQWVEFWEGDENELAYQAVQSAAKGETATFEGFCKTIKGNGKWWDVSVAPIFGADGKPIRMIATSRNISERREFEDALHRSNDLMEFVLDVAQVGIWSLDVDSKNTTRSLRHDQIFGYEKLLPEWNYEMFLDHILPEYRKAVNKQFQLAIEGKTEWNFETEIKRADGKIRWISARGKIQENGDDALKMHGTVTDITKRKEAESERERLLENEKAARKDAEIANHMRDEFLATVSHELRAPLNSILGWGRLMQKGKLDEKTTENAVDTIVRNSESQNRLIEDLLDVSRIISGKLRLEVMTIKPINIVESALETIRPAAEAKGITLEVKEDADVSHISGDMNRLQQVLWNLLSNAIKFTPNDGKVTLEIEREEDFVNLHIKDTGVGIKEEFLPYVFDRFRQADASSIRKFGGLGLGLAIVRHITEMHGGTVHVTSEGEGKGSTFTVRLPLVVSPHEQDSEVRPSAENIGLERDSKLSLDGLLILVVDDEEDTRHLLKQAMTFYGATVITADSAANALVEIQDKNPDVLVSDIGMPEEDGYSLIRKIRNLPDAQQKQTPAIALTAFTRAKDRMQALSSGYQNHVSKPVEPDELITVIASIMGRLQTGDDDLN
ncbi:MAG: PAS domain S-box protein [Acidobacteriota bacterium]|nr:PAS domain S-box protein [Acidobacteriota bacterium]